MWCTMKWKERKTKKETSKIHFCLSFVCLLFFFLIFIQYFGCICSIWSWNEMEWEKRRQQKFLTVCVSKWCVECDRVRQNKNEKKEKIKIKNNNIYFIFLLRAYINYVFIPTTWPSRCYVWLTIGLTHHQYEFSFRW